MPVKGLSLTPFQPNSGRRRFAENDAVRVFDARDDRRIDAGHVVGVNLRAALSGHVSRQSQVLDGDRHTMNCAEGRAGHHCVLCPLGGGKRMFGGEVSEGVQLAVEGVDAIQDGARQLDRGNLLGANGRHEFGRRCKAEIFVVHGLVP